MSHVLTILLLVLFLLIPAIFWFKGKQFLGEKTHPAAIFILSYFASVTVLSIADIVHSGAGKLSLLWVAINFAVFSIIKKIRRKTGKDSSDRKDDT